MGQQEQTKGLEEPRGKLRAKERPLEDTERTPTAAFWCSRRSWPHSRGLLVDECNFEEHR